MVPIALAKRCNAMPMSLLVWLAGGQRAFLWLVPKVLDTLCFLVRGPSFLRLTFNPTFYRSNSFFVLLEEELLLPMVALAAKKSHTAPTTAAGYWYTNLAVSTMETLAAFFLVAPHMEPF